MIVGRVCTALKTNNMFNQYYNPHAAGSFSGADVVFREMGDGTKAGRKEVKEWLRDQDTYTKHFPIRRKFRTNKYKVYTINEQFQADLADVNALEKDNDGFKYILTCIDIFSKYAWAIPLKDKTGSSVKTALEKIFEERTPEKIQTDQGKEFENTQCKMLFNKLGIKHFNALSSDTKCAVVERFNRTLKNKMWRYFTHKNTRRYVDVLDDLIHSYNNTWHSVIRMKPALVTEKNVKEVWHTLNSPEKKRKEIRKYKFSIGDHVRISKARRVFKRGYKQGWSEEIFKVYKQLPRQPPVYEIQDLNGETIKGVFYEPELQKVTEPKVFIIETVIRSVGKGTKRKHYVKWKGYPTEFNSWVPDSDIQHL